MAFRPLFQVADQAEAFEPLPGVSESGAPAGFRPLVPGRLGAAPLGTSSPEEAARQEGFSPLPTAAAPTEVQETQASGTAEAGEATEAADGHGDASASGDALDAEFEAADGDSAVEDDAVEDVALRKAYDEAYAMGHAEGLEAGQKEVAARIERLDALLAELAGTRRTLLTSATEDVAAAVTHIARAVVQRELRVDSSGVAQLVGSVIEHLQADEEIVVRVAPEDEILMLDQSPGLLERLGRNGSVAVLADPGLHPGGAVVETKLGAIDASVETRFAAFADEVEEWTRTETHHAQ